MLGLENVEQLKAVELGALQPDVEENQVRALGHDRSDSIVAVARGARDIALVFQNTGDQITDIGFVVDNENF
jgi:hypothetical protein